MNYARSRLALFPTSFSGHSLELNSAFSSNDYAFCFRNTKALLSFWIKSQFLFGLFCAPVWGHGKSAGIHGGSPYSNISIIPATLFMPTLTFYIWLFVFVIPCRARNGINKTLQVEYVYSRLNWMSEKSGHSIKCDYSNGRGSEPIIQLKGGRPESPFL